MLLNPQALSVIRIGLVIFAAFAAPAAVHAETERPAIPVEQQRVLKKQHLGLFNPPGYVVVRRGYAYRFGAEHLVPNWVAILYLLALDHERQGGKLSFAWL